MSTVRLQKELSYDEAVRVLGFEPGAIVSPHLPAFRQVEEKLCQLIDTTKDDELKTSFREELGRLNEALRVVESGKDREPPTRVAGMKLRLFLSLFLVGCLVAIAWGTNQMVMKERAVKAGRTIEALAVDGRIAVENRRWEEAEEVYGKMESLAPGLPRAEDGFRSIAAGRDEERRQNLGFLLGTARAAVDRRDWDEAETRSKEVLAMEAGNAEALGYIEKIKAGRVHDIAAKLLESAEEALREEDWKQLGERTEALAEMAPSHEELPRLRRLSEEGMKILAQRRIEARRLYELALSLDGGEYSQEGLDAVREAIRLSDEADFQTLYKKMSSYTRLLHVPGEFPTIAEALKSARESDKILIAEGTYEEALELDAKVELEGAGPDKTIISCEAKTASVVLVSKSAAGSRLASMTFRHTGASLAEERFPVVAIDGSELNLEDCTIENGAGHGVAVINGGMGRLRTVRVTSSGWDGLAVYGSESRADVSDSRFEANFQHGVDAWAGGSVDLRKSRCTANDLSGVVLMSTGVKSVLTQCTLDRNREVGVVISNGSQAVLRSNRAEENLLGGFLVQGEGTTAELEGNVALRNLKVGIVIDKRAILVSFKDNESSGNQGEQLALKADLPQELDVPPPINDPPRAVPVEAAGPGAEPE